MFELILLESWKSPRSPHAALLKGDAEIQGEATASQWSVTEQTTDSVRGCRRTGDRFHMPIRSQMTRRGAVGSPCYLLQIEHTEVSGTPLETLT